MEAVGQCRIDLTTRANLAEGVRPRGMTKLRDYFDRTVAWLKGRSRAQADLAVIAALTIPLYFFLFHVNAFDLFHEWSRDHEGWQLDELIVLAFFLGLAAMVFGWPGAKGTKG